MTGTIASAKAYPAMDRARAPGAATRAATASRMTATATGTEENSSCQRPPLTPMSSATCGVACVPICQPCCLCPAITSGETRTAPATTATQNRLTSSRGEPSGASRPPGSALPVSGVPSPPMRTVRWRKSHSTMIRCPAATHTAIRLAAPAAASTTE